MIGSRPYDAIVIGSGFAGAVTACRLAEAGLHVCILERGRRFDAEADFPVYPTLVDPNVPPDASEMGRSAVQPDVSRMFWTLGNGVWDFRDLGDVLVGQAAGFGGGSLIYANVHLRPPEHVFDERWPLKRNELDPYFDLAAAMLRVAPLPADYARLPKKVQLERAATDLQHLQFPCASDETKDQGTYLRSFSPPLAVNFDSKRVGEQGVCDLAGNCCLGCPKKAKNTLDLNYLGRAEHPREPGRCAEVRTLAEVTGIKQLWKDEGRGGRFEVTYLDHLARKAEKSVCAENVFLCAGAVNSTELLLRCEGAKTLKPSVTGLGTRFHTNQDVLAAVFDCDEPQELDRGPTITASLAYDRMPGEEEPSARWRVGFTGAAFEPRVGSEVACGSEGKARIASPAHVVSGSYEDRNAAGDLILSELKLQGDFAEGNELRIDTAAWATVDTKPRQLRHWFLIQDGGLPTPVEPGLGVFRSPLWLGRNAFREKQRPAGEEDGPREEKNGGSDVEHYDHAAASKRIGFATLPFEALTDLFSGLTRGATGRNFDEISELGLQRLRAPDLGSRDAAHSQLPVALTKLKQRALDRIGLASEGVAAGFLEDAANSLEPQLIEAVSKLPGVDVKQFEQLRVPSRVLRLGIQLLWGSQSGLARAIAAQLLSTPLAGRGGLMEAGVELLKRVLDYRLGDGRTAMLLSMGLDSVPGKLELVLPASPRIGTELRGAESGARAVVLRTELHEDTSGSVVVTGKNGDFTTDELLFAGPTKIGKYQKIKASPAVESSKNPGSTQDELGFPLYTIHFKPPGGRALASTAPLRAKLPDAIDTPERGVQERVLRDMASNWSGELRTSPLWTFLDRHLTVHPQGGCPMGKDEEHGVTNEAGEVYGCDGLYVMDAAAFPGPVGANPSATIAAVAEYKAELFLKARLAKLESQLPEDHELVKALKVSLKALEKEQTEAMAWVNDQGREDLDPLGPLGRVKPEPRSAEPAHRPVGIQFTETMVGTVDGAGGHREIEVGLTAKIDDLTDFLGRHARDSDARVSIVKGCLKIGRDDPVGLDPSKSRMRVMVDRGLDESGGEVRTIEYTLVSRDGHYRIQGEKTIRDDEGMDAWDDTTVLEFRMCERGMPNRGVLRLPAQEFFNNQLPSFEADTDDPARQVWAMVSFAKFFFGHLVDVYFPGLDQLNELGGSLLGRAHG